MYAYNVHDIVLNRQVSNVVSKLTKPPEHHLLQLPHLHWRRNPPRSTNARPYRHRLGRHDHPIRKLHILLG